MHLNHMPIAAVAGLKLRHGQRTKPTIIHLTQMSKTLIMKKTHTNAGIKLKTLLRKKHFEIPEFDLDEGPKKTSKLFLNADVSTESIDACIAVAPMFAGTTTPPKGLGFSLIGSKLVPNDFLLKVESALMHIRLNCYETTAVDDLFAEEFLASLTASERDVLGEVVLLQIELGHIPLTLLKTREAA